METSSNHARIGEKDIPVIRFKLRAWLHLEDIRTELLDAAKQGDREKFVSLMYAYVSAASSIPIDELTKCIWYEITRAYLSFYTANLPNLNLPLIKLVPEDKKLKVVTQTDGWEYPGRLWFMWADIFARNYGWSLEYVAELDVDDALALMQEIRLNEQLDREWEWSLSENAFSYDANTKKSKFNPLPRPNWMKSTSQVEELPTVKIKKTDLPAGIVLRWEDGKTSRPQ